MTTQPKTTEAENPYLTREDALAILNTPDDQLDALRNCAANTKETMSESTF